MQLYGMMKNFICRPRLLGPLLYILTVEFTATEIIVAIAWQRPYSWTGNTISDLGSTVCGTTDGRWVCSPLHPLMNLSFVVMGILMIFGSVLVNRELNGRTRLSPGFSLLVISGLGTLTAGLFPVSTVLPLHLLGASAALLLGNVGVALLGTELAGLSRVARLVSLGAGVAGVLATGFFLFHAYLGVGMGGLERLITLPQVIWMPVSGAYLLHTSRRDRRSALRAV